MEEKYSKEFMDAYKERLRCIWNGETFDYPGIFNSNFVASSAIAFVGDDLSSLKGSLKGILYNDDKYTIRREEEK